MVRCVKGSMQASSALPLKAFCKCLRCGGCLPDYADNLRIELDSELAPVSINHLEHFGKQVNRYTSHGRDQPNSDKESCASESVS